MAWCQAKHGIHPADFARMTPMQVVILMNEGKGGTSKVPAFRTVDEAKAYLRARDAERNRD